MTPLSERFPEIGRYAASELSRMRVIAAVATTVLIGACFLSMACSPLGSKDELFKGAILVQALVVLVYGTARAAGAVRAERQEKTWDMQRLTPLSSFEIAFGKCIGAPLFSYFLAILMLPWAIVGVFVSNGAVSFTTLLGSQAFLAALTFLAVSSGLLVSSHTIERVSKPIAEVLGLFLGIFAITVFMGVVTTHSARSHVVYFDHDWSEFPWLTTSALLFGLWAFMGANWRIGRDLLEGGRIWRLPAFMAFLLLFQAGLLEENYHAITLAALVLVYAAALLNPEGHEQWRKWLSGKRFLSNDIPVAVATSLSYVLYAAFSTEFLLLYWNPQNNADWRMPLLLSLFLVRDCAILQGFRFFKIRYPEAITMIFSGLSYALPIMVLKSLDADRFIYIFAPYPDDDVGVIRNILPSLLQALAMLSILLLVIRKRFWAAASAGCKP
ncbi:MAG TPA: hypothetical protein DCM05_17080 [Elusimicrobia bacterium]|nr:hypothetical protein [Elusimicrobiota bacterium]